MSRVIAAAFATVLVAIALPTAASAQCSTCYVPPQPCCAQPQYQVQTAPAQYRTVQETVMVSPAASSPIGLRRSIAP